MFLLTRATIREAVYTTGYALNTVVDWYNLIREVCTHSGENQTKMVETAARLVQIDESYFSWRRKYGKGRLMRGNLDENGSMDVSDELPDWNTDDSSDQSFNVEDPPWSWVLEIYANKQECCFIRVRDRSSATLVSIIENYVESGSVLVTDLWSGYKILN